MIVTLIVPGLGLATEWIEIIAGLSPYNAFQVSVLRPSGLKYEFFVVKQ